MIEKIDPTFEIEIKSCLSGFQQMEKGIIDYTESRNQSKEMMDRNNSHITDTYLGILSDEFKKWKSVFDSIMEKMGINKVLVDSYENIENLNNVYRKDRHSFENLARSIVVGKEDYYLAIIYSYRNEITSAITCLSDILGLNEKNKHKDALGSLKEEFDEFCITFFDETGDLIDEYKENYHRAIDYYESGDYFASTLTIGRIFDHVMNKIKSSAELAKENEPKAEKDRIGHAEAIIQECKGLLKDDKENVAKDILVSGKKIRNLGAHDIGYFSDLTTSLQLFSGFFQLLKLYKIWLIEKSKNDKNE